MSETVKLSDTPRILLNPRAWTALRSFAPNDLLALIYINAPYPDEANPNGFFWDRPGSASDAVRCYKTGRSLLRQCRSLLNSGKLVATGRNASGKREIISASEWVDLWPMFATNRAVGPDRVYEEIQVSKATSSETPHAQLFSDCIAWLKQRKIAGPVGKKFVLYTEAHQKFGNALTHVIFHAAYLAVFGRGRGRPKSGAKSKN
jgi:hypothetical protein